MLFTGARVTTKSAGSKCVAKSTNPLSESEVRWLQAERALIAREISFLQERLAELARRLDTAEAKTATHDTRLAVLEKPQPPAAAKAAPSQSLWDTLRPTIAMHVWKVGIGLLVLCGYRILAGRWPQQELLSVTLKAIF